MKKYLSPIKTIIFLIGSTPSKVGFSKKFFPKSRLHKNQKIPDGNHSPEVGIVKKFFSKFFHLKKWSFLTFDSSCGKTLLKSRHRQKIFFRKFLALKIRIYHWATCLGKKMFIIYKKNQDYYSWFFSYSPLSFFLISSNLLTGCAGGSGGISCFFSSASFLTFSINVDTWLYTAYDISPYFVSTRPIVRR